MRRTNLALHDQSQNTDKNSMDRKLLLHLLLAFMSLLLLTNCTRPNKTSSRIAISFPQSLNVSQSVGALVASSKWGVGTPSVPSQFNCYAVAIGALTSLNNNLCTNISGNTVLQTGIVYGVFPGGSTQYIDVPSGAKRTISLIGFKASNPAECHMISGTPINSLNPTNFSAPHLLDQVTMDLNPGDLNLTLKIPSTMGSTTLFEDCAPFSFGSGSATPLTVTAITPTSGPTSGGTNVTISGTGFDASTTVDVGTTTCTVSTFTSSTISCTTGSHSAGLQAVTVYRGVGSTALPSSFTYVASPILSFNNTNPMTFGTVASGASSSNVTLTLQNTGGATATTMSGATMSGHFNYATGSYPGGGTCGGALTAGSSCTIILRFNPTTTGSLSDSITVTAAGGVSATHNLSGTGTAPNTAILAIDESPLYDFGTYYMNMIIDHTFTVSNVGSANATSLAASPDLTPPFMYKGGSFPGTGGTCTNGSTLNAGSNCTIVVTYAPTSPGPHTDTISISYHDGVTTTTTERDVQGFSNSLPTFNIQGISGGIDVTLDNVLKGHVYPTIDWGDTPIETSFDITIYMSDGTTVVCSTQSVAANVLTYTFGTCPLSYGSTYKARVAANTPSGTIEAANSLYTFTTEYLPIVEAKYPSFGYNWNDYIYNNSDSSCSTGSSSCLHAGEIRKVVLSVEPSCTGLAITDDLGAFDWTCNDSTSYAIFYSLGLKPGKKLANLLSGSSFTPNRVTITGGATTYYSDLEIWWSNPVSLIGSNASSQTLGAVGAIYTYTSDIYVGGFNITADKISVVGQNNSWMHNDPGFSNNCSSANAGLSGADRNCLIAASAFNFLWIEGNFEGGNLSSHAIFTYNTKFSRFVDLQLSHFSDRNLYALGTEKSIFRNILTSYATGIGGYGLYLSTAQNNVIDSIFANTNAVAGVQLDNSSYNNKLQNIRVNDNGDGLTINNGSTYNKIKGIYAFNNRYYGLDILGGSNNNIVVDVAVSGGTYGGIYLEGSNGLRISNVTVANSVPTNSGGIRVRAMDNLILHNVLSMNNDWGLEFGFNTGPVNTSTVTNLAVGGPTTYNVTLNSSSIDFVGVNKMSATCFNNASTGMTSACAPNVGTLVSASIGAGTLVGKVTTDDAVNTVDSSGTATYSSIMGYDWFNFLKPLRGWGLDGGTFPVLSNRGYCNAGTCRIWDLSLLSTDTTLRNITGNGTAANGVFTNGTTCPGVVSGSDVVTHGYTGEQFVRNATEIMFDGAGDDDGMCENGEACIYNPNFGVYQGSGNPMTQSCNFTNATVSGVTMHAYPVNGE